jgi:hypothetical protein
MTPTPGTPDHPHRLPSGFREDTDLVAHNQGPYVYALHDGTAIKIGHTTRHPSERLRSLQTGNPRRLRLLAYTSTLDERAAHGLLGRWRTPVGEWFSPSPQVLAAVATWDWLDAALYGGLTKGAADAAAGAAPAER